MDKYDFVLICIYLVLVIVVTFASTSNKKIRKKKKKKLRTQVFWFSLFLTPVAGIIIYLRNREKKFTVGESRYLVTRYKCDDCGYKFDEFYDHCPICEKEGKKSELEEVKQIMT